MSWMIENTLIATALALIVALVCRSKRLPPVVRHGLWLVVLMRLIAPPVFSLSLPFRGEWRDFSNWLRMAATTEMTVAGRGMSDPPALPGAVSESTPDNKPAAVVEVSLATTAEFVETSPRAMTWPEPDRPSQEISLPGPSNHELPIASIQTSPGVPAAANDPPPAELLPRPFFTLLVWGSAVGTFLTVVVQAARIVRMWRIVNRSRPASVELASTVRDLAVRLKVHAPLVRLSSDVHSPLVCTLGRAVLLWPEARVADLPEPGLRAVIVHELAHLARRDHWIGWLELVAGCLWWWNPLFWYVRHQVRENAELACDAWVVGVLPEGRRDYARALVELADFHSAKHRAAPALGLGDGSRELFERRLVMIMGAGVRYRLGASGLIGVGLLALAALPGCTTGEAAVEPPATGNQTASSDPAQSAAVGPNSSPAGLPLESDDPFRSVVGRETDLEIDPNAAVAPEQFVDPRNDKPEIASPSSKTLTITIVATDNGQVASLTVGLAKLFDGPLNEGRLEEFDRRLKDVFAIEGAFDQVLLRVSKNLDHGELMKIVDACKQQKTKGGNPVSKISLVDLSAATDAAPSADERLKRLEDRFDAILTELRELKKPESSSVKPGMESDPSLRKTAATYKSAATKSAKPSPATPSAAASAGLSEENNLDPRARKRNRAEGDPETVNLIRKTYKLPPGRAQAVAAFLTQNLNDEIEVRVKGEALQVTATAEDQTAIAQLLRLLQTRGSVEPKPSVYRPESSTDSAPKLQRQVEALEQYKVNES